jgi:pyruvate formate lyase activating enzyme
MSDLRKEAVLWKPAEGKAVDCSLCNWRCHIPEGKLGHCRVRHNSGGTLFTLTYDKVCAANVDPIEKKPLYHFLPGSKSFSIACPGCNFQCAFCQNWPISQEVYEGAELDGEPYTPQEIVAAAKRGGCKSISYTYTEPTLFMELAAECGTLARSEGMDNVFVTNGYMTREAIDFAAPWLGAVNIDLKAFSEDYYKNLCKARLQPVLDTIEYIAKSTKIWMEVTTLLVPGENDSDEELKKLTAWLVEHAGPDVPWHISRFYPQYKYKDAGPTPVESLEAAFDIGRAAGLKYVYMGNVPGAGGEDTMCAGCGKMLIRRMGYTIVEHNLTANKCPACNIEIAGVWG